MWIWDNSSVTVGEFYIWMLRESYVCVWVNENSMCGCGRVLCVDVEGVCVGMQENWICGCVIIMEKNKRKDVRLVWSVT